MIARLWAVLAALVKQYPAAVAAGLNVAVALLARFGFHVSSTELAVIVSMVAAALGAWVHSQVTPAGKKR
jgi:hypothetical protein